MVQAPNLSQLFEMMTYTSTEAIGEMLGQNKDRKTSLVHYMSRILNKT